MRFELGALALAVTVAMSSPARAAQSGSELEMCDPGTPCRIASAAQLDELRGGFDVDTGSGLLHVGIGITRSVSLNGRVVAVSELTIPDLGASLAMSRRLAHAPGLNVMESGGALIVQNGPGNFAPPAASFGSSAMPTIVQNTIDNQKLGTLTIVHAWVNSLSVLRTMRTSEMLQRATAASGR